MDEKVSGTRDRSCYPHDSCLGAHSNRIMSVKYRKFTILHTAVAQRRAVVVCVIRLRGPT